MESVQGVNVAQSGSAQTREEQSGGDLGVACQRHANGAVLQGRWNFLLVAAAMAFGEEFGLKIRRCLGAVGKRVKKQSVSSPIKATRSKLAPINITTDPVTSSPPVEIRLRGGRAVLIDARVDTRWLSRLLVVVESAA